MRMRGDGSPYLEQRSDMFIVLFMKGCTETPSWQTDQADSMLGRLQASEIKRGSRLPSPCE